jgi:hypothetical protein
MNGDEKYKKNEPVIEQIDVGYADKPVNPEARVAVERLIARWLVRAYLQNYNEVSHPHAQEAA